MSEKICPQCGTRYAAEHRFCTLDGASLVSEHPDSSLIGRIIADRYHVTQKLGEGGMGEVYLAEHVRIRRKVAVKIMRKWMAEDHVALGRFHREAENASQISHPNVATIYDFGETNDGIVYFAMEYVDGKPLTAVLEAEGRLGVVRSLDIVRQTADALSAAHHLGILHRDLKPDNVMVGTGRAGTDLVKLVDFGISRVMNRGTQQFTSTGMIVGTPDYMSPEQLSGDTMDARTDLYALALIAYRMLTGTDAYGKGSPHETLMWRLTRAPRPLREVCPDVEWPAVAQQLFERALAADPEVRFSDAIEFANVLDQVLAHVALTPADEAYLQALAMRSATPPRGFGTVEGTLTPPRAHVTIDLPTPQPRPAHGVSDAAQGGTVPPRAAPVPSAATSASPTSASPESVAAAGGAPAGSETAAAAGFTPISSPESQELATATGPTAVRRRAGLYVAAGGVVLVVALAMLRGRDAPADAAPADSAAAVGAPAPAPVDSARDSALANAGAPSDAMDRAAVVARYPRSVFAVSSATGRGTGFLIDSAGLVLTAARLAPAASDAVVEVQVDGERKYRAPVVRREGQLAVVLIPRSACRACPVLPLAADSAAQKGDSVVAIGSPQHQADARIRDVVLREVSATRISASPGVDARNVGTPLLSSGGAVVAVASGRDGFVPATAARTLLEKIRATRLAVTADSALLPTWPARRLAAKDRARAETREVNDTYRAKEDGFAVLVMTPRVMAWRRAAADSAREAYNPFEVASTLKPGPDGISDPIQRWSEWDEYWNERRAVVVIEVAPEAAPQPFHGSARPIQFDKGNPASVVLKRDGSPVAAIENASVSAVTNVPDYGTRPVFNSALAVFSPTVFAAEGRFTLEVSDAARGGKVVTIEVAPRTLRAIRSDLAAFITP